MPKSTRVLLFIVIAAGLYASYKYDQLVDRISDLEQQVEGLEGWREHREQAEDRQIELEAKELIEAGEAEGKTLGEMLDQALRQPRQGNDPGPTRGSWRR